jgi:hypothetical protein
MKKIIILGLSFCLLFTACGQHTITPSEGEDLSNSVESTSLDTESISIPSEQETKPAKELHPEMYNQSATGDYIETEDAIYYYDKMRQRIYFSVDNGSHFYPLCSKANCTHSDENCTASGKGVAYFEGALYTIRFDDMANLFRVVRISLDGTDQGVIQSIPFPGSGGFKFYYHDGKAFLIYLPSNNLPLEEMIERFFVVDLATGELTEPLQEMLKDGLCISSFHFYQNIMTAYTEGTYVSSGLDEARALYIDMDTWNVREYMKGVGKSVYYMDDSKLYFVVANAVYFEKGNMHIEKTSDLDEGFYEVDIRTGEIVKCLTTEDVYRARYDEDYIYVTSYPRDKDGQQHTLYIYNRDYELLEQKELENYQYLVFASSDRLFFAREYDFSKIYNYMEKSDIGSGDMQIYDVNK